MDSSTLSAKVGVLWQICKGAEKYLVETLSMVRVFKRWALAILEYKKPSSFHADALGVSHREMRCPFKSRKCAYQTFSHAEEGLLLDEAL